MRIAVVARSFAPEIGGVQTVAALLAAQWARLGHEVTILTRTGAAQSALWQVCALEGSAAGASRAALARAHAIIWHDPMLGDLPLLAPRARKVCVVLHRRFQRDDGRRALQDHFKRLLPCGFRSVAASRALARLFVGVGVVVPPPLDPHIATGAEEIPWHNRPDEFVYLGRLVSGKGLDTLLEAMHRLNGAGRPRRLVIAGEGPCRTELQGQVEDRALGALVRFSGPITRDRLPSFLRRFKGVVMPSEFFEAFGLAALEGLAAGCVPVGTTSGGLPEAIGPCGFLVPPRDPTRLAGALQRTLDDERARAEIFAARPRHLAHFDLRAIGQRYLDLFPRPRATRLQAGQVS